MFDSPPALRLAPWQRRSNRTRARHGLDGLGSFAGPCTLGHFGLRDRALHFRALAVSGGEFLQPPEDGGTSIGVGGAVEVSK